MKNLICWLLGHTLILERVHFKGIDAQFVFHLCKRCDHAFSHLNDEWVDIT